MKKLSAVFIVVLVALALFVSCSQPQPEPTSDPEGFTTMFYMDISNLDAMDDLNELIAYNHALNEKTAVYFITGGAADPEIYKEKTGNLSANNDPFEKRNDAYVYPALAAALKESGFEDNGINPFATSFIPDKYQYWTYLPDSKTGKSIFKLVEETKRMSDGDVLTDFIDRVYNETKGKNTKYILMLWDHGAGPVGGLIRDMAGDYYPPRMSIQDFYNAVNNSKFIKDEKKFEALIMDMCLMQTIEDLNMMKTFTKCSIGSENLSYSSGYGMFFNYLDNNLKADYKGVSTAFINSASLKHEQLKQLTYTWSSFDLTDTAKIGKMNKAFNDFIKAAADSTEGVYKKLNDAAANSVEYISGDVRMDNYDILSVAGRFYGDTDSVEYKALKESIEGICISEKHGSAVKAGKDGNEPGSTGLAFFFCPAMGKNIGEEKTYTEAAFENYCERVKDYFSKDVSDFYIAYRAATAE